MQRERWFAPACAAGVMNHFGLGCVNDRFTARAQAVAKVHVFGLEDVRLVEAADGTVSIAAEQDEHAGDPVHA